MAQSMMHCIPSYTMGSKRDPHTCNETRGLACDGCPLLSCIKQRSRLRPYRFWCDHVHHLIDPSIGCERKPKPASPRFHEVLCDAMEREGIDRFALAEAVGASPETVRSWTSGKVVPRRDFMKRIAELLHVDVDPKEVGWQSYHAAKKARLGI